MSDQPPYPPPPSQPPYGQQPPQQPPYPPQPAGQPPYGQNPYGGPSYAQTPTYDYAGWGTRVGASLIDGLLTLVAGLPYVVGIIWFVAATETRTRSDGTSSSSYDGGPLPFVLMAFGFLLYLAFWIWNYCIRQGRTGQTLGKSNLGVRLVKEDTGQPIGAGLSFVRQLAHVLDGFCYIGYLWPLWDAKRQTFADKVMSTVVVRDR